MPPRRSPRLAAAEEAASVAFPQLPHAVVLRIFAALPADARLRCCEVSRGWRATASHPELWQHVDMSPASGVRQPASLALLRAALAKARALEALHVTPDCDVPLRELEGIVHTHRGSFQQLSGVVFSVDEILTIARAAPLLRELRADVVTATDAAEALLRNEGVLLAALRIKQLFLVNPTEQGLLALRPALVDPALHPSLTEVFWDPDPSAPMGAWVSEAAMGVLTDAYVARRLPLLNLRRLNLMREAEPVLGRLIRDGALTELSVAMSTGVFEAPTADAFRANRTLTRIRLVHCDLWRHRARAVQCLDALVGHPMLRELCLSGNDASHALEIPGAPLARLLAADAPALTTLDVFGCSLGDVGLALLLGALPGNHHLRALDIRGNGMTAAFARERLLPAVRANTSLRELKTGFEGNAAVWETLAFLAQR